MPVRNIFNKTSSKDEGRGKKSNLMSSKWFAADHAMAHDNMVDAAQLRSGV